MSDRNNGPFGGLGGVFGDNSEILFFILVFLFLFFCNKDNNHGCFSKD